ncbi:MAG TPA: hypothetical protein VIK53_16550 [Verrucomicrobiae bacterium]
MTPSNREKFLAYGKLVLIWYLILSGILAVVCVCLLLKLMVANDPKHTFIPGLRLAGLVLAGAIVNYIPALIIAAIQLWVRKKIAQVREKMGQAREFSRHKQAQKEQQKMLAKHMDDSARAQDVRQKSDSLHEVISLLGSIDGYIRVLDGQPGRDDRTMMLQKAQFIMVKLVAKSASGEISRDTLDNSHVRELAAETSKDLARLGLADDRLNRDLVRMFKLKSK